MSLPKPFKISIPQEQLDWITSRVQTARIIPDLQHPKGQEWSYGIPSKNVQELAEFWRTSYDWREVEEEINSKFKMFTLELDVEDAGERINVHFVHHQSARKNAVPLLFAHGWPGSFLEVANLLEPLTDPKDEGAQAYHVVAPSIPGFSFSSSPQKPGFSPARIATLYHNLMKSLGYPHFLGQGGDWGSIILRALAQKYPHACIGVHLNFIVAQPPPVMKHPLSILWLVLRWFSDEEKKRLGRMKWWFDDESGYSKIQGTKPQTVSYALQDSPIGMLAWIREKMEELVDDDFVWDPKTVITWTMMYIIPGTAANASIYKEAFLTGKEDIMDNAISAEVPVGYSSFPKDVGYVTKWWAEASVAKKIVFWKEHDKGGHFPSLECADVLVADIEEFVEKIKASDRERWDRMLLPSA